MDWRIVRNCGVDTQLVGTGGTGLFFIASVHSDWSVPSPLLNILNPSPNQNTINERRKRRK